MDNSSLGGINDMTATARVSFSSLSDDQQANIALMRFGLGPKIGSAKRLISTPAPSAGISPVRQACLNELALPNAALINPAGLPTSAESARAGALTDQGATIESNTQLELKARYAKALNLPIGFVERLVLFWANHFSVCRDKCGRTRATAADLERNVIRAHALGNFSAMLQGVMQHSAMMLYLDNFLNFGPTAQHIIDSNKTSNRGLTLNENLAREILELHTLGLDNYHEADVRSLAKIMTGWRVVGNDLSRRDTVMFHYEDAYHEPGAHTLLLGGANGKTFSEKGQAQGLAALDYLAKQPATANHIAKKLLRHFVKDNPSTGMIEKIAKVFYDNRDSPTQLKEVAKALILMDEAWTEPMDRIRPPNLWLISVTRALALTREKSDQAAPGYRYYLGLMHNEPWRNRTPDGYSDFDLAWRNPGTVYLRMEIAMQMVNALLTDAEVARLVPAARFENLFPLARGNAGMAEIKKLAAARNKKTAMAFMFMTPEFMHR